MIDDDSPEYTAHFRGGLVSGELTVKAPDLLTAIEILTAAIEPITDVGIQYFSERYEHLES